MTGKSDEATYEGGRLIKNWLAAQRRFESVTAELQRAQCEVANSARELAKWMIPEDAKGGEKICVWHHDSLFQVEVGSDGQTNHKVTVRKRGRKFQELAA